MSAAGPDSDAAPLAFSPRELVGYAKDITVRSGEPAVFMVSSRSERYRAELVRLIHGDTNPAGPGFKCERVASRLDGDYPGREQRFHPGSYIHVDDAPALDGTGGLRLRACILPTLIDGEPRAVISKLDHGTKAGWALMLDPASGAVLWLGDSMTLTTIATERALRLWSWYVVEAEWNPATGKAVVAQKPLRRLAHERSEARVEAELVVEVAQAPVSLLIGAVHSHGDPSGHFNGKIDNPSVRDHDGAVVADWDFSREIATSVVTDVSGNGHDGLTVNQPMRAVTGVGWSGRELDWRRAPDEYSAIFFHEDDLIDARWEESLRFSVPDELQSGLYAVRLTSDSAVDHVPFVVVPGRTAQRRKIAVLLPTFSYLAYANNHFSYLAYEDGERTKAGFERLAQLEPALAEADRYARDQRLLSLYDRHADGAGCCFASFRRPLVNMRPDYRHARCGAPHQLGADLHLVDWLEAKGFDYDVISDDELDREGLSLLTPYSVVITGSHPEYWTASMLTALEEYVDGPGRLMYLGGNGFYWVVSVDCERPFVIEIRRGLRGTGTWRSAVGEGHHQTTGEPGGLWRDRGRAPQRLVGVGMASEGFDPARPYVRRPASCDERAAFIFEGVPADALIGDCGLVLGGAGGFEIDRSDLTVGTPPHALLLASATGLSDGYQRVIEEVAKTDPHQGGSQSPHVRADMVFFETAGGGAVFSTGSIAWCGALSANGYHNHVSRITENVLRRFVADEAFGQAAL